MTDLAVLDSKIRAWLERVPLSAIVIALKAIHDELKFRNRTPRPPGLWSRDRDLGTAHSSSPESASPLT